MHNKTLKTSKSLRINILSHKKDENCRKHVKYGETILFHHKFHLKNDKLFFKFVSAVGILSKDFVPGVGFLKEKFSGPGISPWREMVTVQGHTCITAI